MNMRANIATKNEIKVKVLKAFFASLLTVRPVIKATSPLRQEWGSE